MNTKSISEQVKEMEWLYCTGELVREMVSYSANRKGYHLIIDDVPVWVCQQCGQPLFDEKTIDAIQDMLRQVDGRLEKLTALSIAA
jgi:YgiT-type zinc finger domain-containing protein